MNSKKIGVGAVFATCLLALAGCGDDNSSPDTGPGDSGTPDTSVVDSGTTTDSGTDSGTATDSGTDSGTDGGTTATDAFIRVANLLPNGSAFRVCASFTGLATDPVGPLPSRAGDDPGVPFRGVSGYLTFPVGVGYTVNFYDIADIDTITPEACPTAADAIDPLVTVDVPAAALEAGKFYTVAATGFVRDADGNMPSLCGATLSDVCPGALEASLQLFSDTGAPAAGKVSIRVIQGIPNMPNLDICMDASAVGDAGTPGPAGSPTLIVSDVAPTAASAYVDMDPITDGFITIHKHVAGSDCVAAATLAAVAVPFPDPVGTALLPGSTKTFPADSVITLFGSGQAQGTTLADRPAFIPMLDEIAP